MAKIQGKIQIEKKIVEDLVPGAVFQIIRSDKDSEGVLITAMRTKEADMDFKAVNLETGEFLRAGGAEADYFPDARINVLADRADSRIVETPKTEKKTFDELKNGDIFQINLLSKDRKTHTYMRFGDHFLLDLESGEITENYNPEKAVHYLPHATISLTNECKK